MTKTSNLKLSSKKQKSVEAVAEVIQNTQLQVAIHFPSLIYLIERPDFLKEVCDVSEEALIQRRSQADLDEIYPLYMSNNYFADPRLARFSEFVGATAWNILHEQGYAMNDRAVSFTEMWTQEHHKHSAMEQHVHNGGSQIVGFYFLETPENCSRVVFHEPRSGKLQIDLPEENTETATPASRMVNFIPKPGLMIFTNSWLAHSFTRHAADKPIKFVHFNLTVQNAPQVGASPTAEVV